MQSFNIIRSHYRYVPLDIFNQTQNTMKTDCCFDCTTKLTLTFNQAKKVESLTSVDIESNQNLILSQDKPLKKSLEDVSAELVKETLAKALSGETNINEDAGSATFSFVESPSKMILVQPQNNSESQPKPLVDTPSTTNLAQINECYENSTETNVNDQPLTDNRDPAEPAAVSEENSEKPTENVNIIITQDSEVKNSVSGEVEDKVEEETELKRDSSNVSTIESKKELYSSSSTHLCSKLSEVFEQTEPPAPSQTSEHQSEHKSEQNMSEPNILEQKTSAHKSESVRSIDLSKHDLRTSVRYMNSFSGYYTIPISLSFNFNHFLREFIA